MTSTTQTRPVVAGIGGRRGARPAQLDRASLRALLLDLLASSGLARRARRLGGEHGVRRAVRGLARVGAAACGEGPQQRECGQPAGRSDW